MNVNTNNSGSSLPSLVCVTSAPTSKGTPAPPLDDSTSVPSPAPSPQAVTSEQTTPKPASRRSTGRKTPHNSVQNPFYEGHALLQNDYASICRKRKFSETSSQSQDTPNRSTNTREAEKLRRQKHKQNADRLRHAIPGIIEPGTEGRVRNVGEGTVMQKAGEYIEKCHKDIAHSNNCIKNIKEMTAERPDIQRKLSARGMLGFQAAHDLLDILQQLLSKAKRNPSATAITIPGRSVNLAFAEMWFPKSAELDQRVKILEDESKRRTIEKVYHTHLRPRPIPKSIHQQRILEGARETHKESVSQKQQQPSCSQVSLPEIHPGVNNASQAGAASESGSDINQRPVAQELAQYGPPQQNSSNIRIHSPLVPGAVQLFRPALRGGFNQLVPDVLAEPSTSGSVSKISWLVKKDGHSFLYTVPVNIRPSRMSVQDQAPPAAASAGILGSNANQMGNGIANYSTYPLANKGSYQSLPVSLDQIKQEPGIDGSPIYEEAESAFGENNVDNPLCQSLDFIKSEPMESPEDVTGERDTLLVNIEQQRHDILIPHLPGLASMKTEDTTEQEQFAPLGLANIKSEPMDNPEDPVSPGLEGLSSMKTEETGEHEQFAHPGLTNIKSEPMDDPEDPVLFGLEGLASMKTEDTGEHEQFAHPGLTNIKSEPMDDPEDPVLFGLEGLASMKTEDTGEQEPFAALGFAGIKSEPIDNAQDPVSFGLAHLDNAQAMNMAHIKSEADQRALFQEMPISVSNIKKEPIYAEDAEISPNANSLRELEGSEDEDNEFPIWNPESGRDSQAFSPGAFKIRQRVRKLPQPDLGQRPSYYDDDDDNAFPRVPYFGAFGFTTGDGPSTSRNNRGYQNYHCASQKDNLLFKNHDIFKFNYFPMFGTTEADLQKRNQALREIGRAGWERTQVKRREADEKEAREKLRREEEKKMKEETRKRKPSKSKSSFTPRSKRRPKGKGKDRG